MEALKNTLRRSFAVLQKYPQLLLPMVVTQVLLSIEDALSHLVSTHLLNAFMFGDDRGSGKSVLFSGGSQPYTYEQWMRISAALIVVKLVVGALLTVTGYYFTLRMLKRVMSWEISPAPTRALLLLAGIYFGTRAFGSLLPGHLPQWLLEIAGGHNAHWVLYGISVLGSVAVWWWVQAPVAMRVSREMMPSAVSWTSTNARLFAVVCVIASEAAAWIVFPAERAALRGLHGAGFTETGLNLALLRDLIMLCVAVVTNVPFVVMFIGFGLMARDEKFAVEPQDIEVPHP